LLRFGEGNRERTWIIGFMVLLLFFTMIFICFMVEGIVMAEDNGDENGGCKHEETIIKRDPEEGWYITDAMH